MDDYTESDISDLDDRELERVVAEWAGLFGCPKRSDECVGGFYFDQNHCAVCGGRLVAPAFVTDPAAAWRLLMRLPPEWKINSKGYATKRACSRRGYTTLAQDYDNPKRALAEAAAILEIRGVEPREVAG